MTTDRAAEVAGEIARLDALVAGSGLAQKRLVSDPTHIKSEIQRGPLKAFLEAGDHTGELALLKARAQLAAYDAQEARHRSAYPPWFKVLVVLLTAIVMPLILGLLVPPLVNLRTSRQLAVRQQADRLLADLSKIVIRARELKNEVAYHEVDGLSPGQAERLRQKAVELEEDFGAAVQLHHFEAGEKLHDGELRAYFEVRALQDCLESAAGKHPLGKWREVEGSDRNLLRGAGSGGPCAGGFDFAAFDAFTEAVNGEIDRRIGGSLFPPKN